MGGLFRRSKNILIQRTNEDAQTTIQYQAEKFGPHRLQTKDGRKSRFWRLCLQRQERPYSAHRLPGFIFLSHVGPEQHPVVNGTGINWILFQDRRKQINFEDPNEPWLNNNLRRGIFVPDADFGIYVLNPRFTFGFSTAQLFGAAAKIGGEAYRNYNMDRHYYIFGTYTLLSGSKTEIQPSALFMMSEELKPLADIGLTYIYAQKFWAGVSYRTSKAIIANFGMTYTNIFIGYSFDFTLQELQRVTYGTHEITIAVRFGDSARKYRWLDRY